MKRSHSKESDEADDNNEEKSRKKAAINIDNVEENEENLENRIERIAREVREGGNTLPEIFLLMMMLYMRNRPTGSRDFQIPSCFFPLMMLVMKRCNGENISHSGIHIII